MRAIRVHEYGQPEVLRIESVPVPEPGPGEARVRIEAAGVNFIDVYHRKGLYPGSLPATLGVEAAGVVDAVGDGVTEISVGERVGYVMQQGAYAEYAVVPAERLIPLPDGVEATAAAALLLQGLTAHYLVHSTFRLEQGKRALVHAAAGGVGLLLIQMAKALGATVYGTVSTEAKAELARDAGADDVILYTKEDFAEAVRRLTGGEGVDVVYDSVGKATFAGSLDSLRPRGYLVLYGQSSGPVQPIDPQVLNAKGSLFLTRPNLSHYALTRTELLTRASQVFQALLHQGLSLRVDSQFKLAEARAAHQRLESRKSSGKLLLVP